VNENFAAYVLTVQPADSQRRQAMCSELARARFEWRFFEGVTPATPDFRARYSPLRNSVFNNRTVTDAELACYASHHAIWTKIAHGDANAALVFEDDARIADDESFYSALTDVSNNLQRFDLVKFFDYRPKRVALSTRIGSTTFVSHKMIATGAVCYLITKKAAQQLLEARPRFFRAVDDDWTHAWELGVRIWSVHPNPVVTEEDGASLIEIERQASRRARSKCRSIWNIMLTAHKQLRTVIYHRQLADR
jgi:glycosyl transferase family 25